MKKIVMGLAALACAASMFAVDLSANVKFQGDLFNYADGAIKMLHINGQSETYAAPAIAMSISNDRAGAQLKIVKVGGAQTADHQIWFKPFETVKVTFGTLGNYALNTETIDWTQAIVGESYGYAAELNTNGISLAVSVPSDVLSKAKDKDVSIGKLYTKAGYTADFGTVAAVAKFNNTFKEMFMGAGYSGTFSGVSLFADVYYCNTNTNSFRDNWQTFYGINKPVIVDTFVKGNADALAYALYVGAAVPTEKADDTSVLVKAKVNYQINALNAYLYMTDTNVMAKDFAMTVKPGVTGNVGGMGFDVAVKLDISKDVKVSVPCEFTMGL